MLSIRQSTVAELRGSHVLVLNWRDPRHPQAGGAEQYIHQVARRWVQEDIRVTWFTSRPPGKPMTDEIDGIRIIRSGGTLSLYAQAAVHLLADGGSYDAIVDCQNGIPFFAPVFVNGDIPIVQVVHHVHQDQFATRFTPPLAAVGRLLEGHVARRVYRLRPTVAVSPSTRHDLRSRLGFTGPIHVVPNGTIEVPKLTGPRDPDPTVVVVSRLVPHKRIDLLLGQIAMATPQVRNLRVEIVGDGPELQRLRNLLVDLGLQRTVALHGFLPNHERDALLSRAWLTTSTSKAEGWGCSVIEAAAWGVPCLALNAPGIRDSVVDGRTGWLVDEPRDFGTTLVSVLDSLADEETARRTTADCQAWARSFSWDRTADLLTGVVVQQMRSRPSGTDDHNRRYGRSDIATVVSVPFDAGRALREGLRATDEVVTDGTTTSVLLTGCDEFDAAAVMDRLGIPTADLRFGHRTDLLIGPQGLTRTGSGSLIPTAAS
jgi:glycosyltransferase involved in cell wall biosynthesis